MRWKQNPIGSTLSSSAQIITAQGIYFDRPTITYSPVSEEKFAPNLMKPSERTRQSVISSIGSRVTKTSHDE
jgi:hypothetical protein